MASDATDLNAEAELRGEAPMAEVSGLCDPNTGDGDIHDEVGKVGSFSEGNDAVDDVAGTSEIAERSGFYATEALSGAVEESRLDLVVTMESSGGDVVGDFNEREEVHNSEAYVGFSETAEEVSGTGVQTHEPMEVDVVDGSRRYGEASPEVRTVVDDLSPSLAYDSAGLNRAFSDVGSEDVDMSIDSSVAEEVGVERVEHGVEDSMARDTTEGTTQDLKIELGEKDICNITEEPPIQHESAGISTVDTEKNGYAFFIFGDKKMDSFSNSDLVWGKIKSHPWWPGQIVDPSNASEMALKYQRKDHFLVAYFGDKTFAWCDDSQLKSFHSFFSQMEKQSSSEVFLAAVGEALDEVSRRMQLAMVCRCVPEESISKFKNQLIENAGTREVFIAVPDMSLDLSSFQPTNFLRYLSSLAKFPMEVADKLDLEIARAQLLAFYRLKGWDRSTVFFSSQEILEGDDFAFPVKDVIAPVCEEKIPSRRGRQKKSSIVFLKPRNTPEDGRKQKSLSELMEGGKDAHLIDEDQGDIDQKTAHKSFLHQRDLNSKPSISCFGTSFRLGECIRRVATKLIGSSPSSECNSEAAQKGILTKIDAETDNPFNLDVSLHSPEGTRMLKMNFVDDNFSIRGMLSQLCSVASGPIEEFDFLYSTIAFFTEIKRFRDSISQEALNSPVTVGRKRGRPKLVHDFHTVKDAKFSDGPACKKGMLKSLPDSFSVEHAEFPEKVRRKRGRPKKVTDSNSVQDVSTSLAKSGRGREKIDTMAVLPELSHPHGPDHMKDSYWTNMVIHSNPEKKRCGRKRKEESLLQSPTKKFKPILSEFMPLPSVSSVQQHVRPGAMSHLKSHIGLAYERQVKYFGKKCVEESSPTAVVLNFSSKKSVPLKKDLMRIFSRYGPIEEAEVLMDMRSATIVFKRRADAEAAFSSAGKCGFYGPDLLSYRLKNLPLTSQNSPHPRPVEKNDPSPVKGTECDLSIKGKSEKPLNDESVGNDDLFLEVLVTKQDETPISTRSLVSYNGKEGNFAARPNCGHTEVLTENYPDDMKISDAENSNAEKDILHLDDDELIVLNGESNEPPVEDKHLVLSFSTGDPKWKDICGIDGLGQRRIGVCAENIKFQDAKVNDTCTDSANFLAPGNLKHLEIRSNRHVESQAGDAPNFNDLEVVGVIPNESSFDSDAPIQIEKVVEYLSLDLTTTAVTERPIMEHGNAEVSTRDDLGYERTCISDASVAEKYKPPTEIGESKVLDRKRLEAPEGGCNFESLDSIKDPMTVAAYDVKVQNHERENDCNVEVQTHERESTASGYLLGVLDTNHKDTSKISCDIIHSGDAAVDDYMKDSKVGPKQTISLPHWSIESGGDFCDVGFQGNNSDKTATASLLEVMGNKHDEINTGSGDVVSSGDTKEHSAHRGDFHVVSWSGSDESLRDCSNIDALSVSNGAFTCTGSMHVLDVKEKDISTDIGILQFPAGGKDSTFASCDESEFLATKIKSTPVDCGNTEFSVDKIDGISKDGGNNKILVDRTFKTSTGDTTMKISDDPKNETNICDGNSKVWQSIEMLLDTGADAESKD